MTIRNWGIQADTEGESRVKFEGELVSEISTQRPRDWRWTELRGWRTKGGKIVVQSIGRSNCAGERNFIRAEIYDDADHMMKEMRYTPLNAKLWRAFGIKEIIVD